MFNRTLPLPYIFFVCLGAIALGYIAQLLTVRAGAQLFVPPVEQLALFLAIAIVVLGFAFSLRSEIKSRKTVARPLRAVRILAAARASQLLGAGFAGFNAGLFLWVLPRFAATAAGIWVPYLLCAVGAVLLAVAGIIAERWCKIPPAATEESEQIAADITGVNPVLERRDPE